MSNFAKQLDWNLLHSFMVVLQEKSMTKAAEALHRTQPAVSQAIKRLEETAGVPLIERRKTGHVPSRAGQDLLEQIRPIYASISRMPLAFSEAPNSVSGKITIASIDQIQSAEMDKVLSGFFKKYPGVDLEMTTATTTSILRSVKLGTCTIGISDGVIPENLLANELLKEEFGLYCGQSHRLSGQKDVPDNELRAEPFVGFTADVLGGKHMGGVTAYRAHASIGQRVRGQSAYVQDVRRMIELGLGIGFLPLHLAERHAARGTIWRLPPYSDLPSAKVYVVSNPEIQFSTAETLFLESLKSVGLLLK